MNKILFTKNSHGARDIAPPSYPGDAGLNVFVCHDVVIPPGKLTRVSLGISVAIPEHLAFTFITRSGAIGKGLFVLPSLIDSGYRGPLFLFVMNVGEEEVYLAEGVSIAQILLIDNHSEVVLQEMAALPDSPRGTKGFNSSGGGLEPTEEVKEWHNV